MNTPKVKIGSAYQPARRVVRGNNGELQSLRGHLDPDTAWLQRTLLQGERVTLSERLWEAFGIVLLVLLLVGVAFIGPEVV